MKNKSRPHCEPSVQNCLNCKFNECICPTYKCKMTQDEKEAIREALKESKNRVHIKTINLGWKKWRELLHEE